MRPRRSTALRDYVWLPLLSIVTLGIVRQAAARVAPNSRIARYGLRVAAGTWLALLLQKVRQKQAS